MIKYAITDPRFYTNLKENFTAFKRLKSADFVLLREKTTADYAVLARTFLSLKEMLNAKFIIHNDVALALKLKADGVHFTSTNLKALKTAPLNLLRLASTHNFSELALAQNADFVTFSPVFPSPNKGAPVGIDGLKRAVDFSRVPVLALGGIETNEQIQAVLEAGAVGFAAIRYFVI